MLILTAFIVGVFYCLDAVHGERRDRRNPSNASTFRTSVARVHRPSVAPDLKTA